VVQAGGAGGGADATLLGAALRPGAGWLAAGADGAPAATGPVGTAEPVGSAEPVAPGSGVPDPEAPDGSASAVELSTVVCPAEPLPYLRPTSSTVPVTVPNSAAVALRTRRFPNQNSNGSEFKWI
jgi:hypothetical protein